MIIVILLFLSNSYASVTYSKIKPILVKHCSGCHNENWPDKNWMDYETARTNRDKIKERVWILKTMPPGNYSDMKDAERELIMQWIDGGASK